MNILKRFFTIIIIFVFANISFANDNNNAVSKLDDDAFLDCSKMNKLEGSREDLKVYPGLSKYSDDLYADNSNSNQNNNEAKKPEIEVEVAPLGCASSYTPIDNVDNY